jgi:hypothetical protein
MKEETDLAKAVEALQAKVETLEKRNSDLALKGQIIGGLLFGKTDTFGLDRFFGEPEFWENTYDSGQADCSARCSKNYQEEMQACNRIEDPTERQQCIQRAYDTVVSCHSNCAQMFPTPIS